ncbi:MAG: hypothetical protein ACK5PQ_03675 [Alphaproteobacteria bacterium]
MYYHKQGKDEMRLRLFLTFLGLFHLCTESQSNGAFDAAPSVPSRHSWNTPDSPHHVQLKNSIDLMYGTLFQNLTFLDQVRLEKFKQEVFQQSLFLRRLYLFLGLGELEYRSETGETSPWPFPLATCLTQGQRVAITLNGVPAREFLEFVADNNLKLFYKRKYSSHGVTFEESTEEVREVKIKSPFRRVKSTEKLLGMDFPFGGVGNLLPDGSRIGPRGYEIRDTRIRKKRQLGHLHVYVHEFPEQNKTVVLIGIEGCAPGTQNQLGCNHTMWSGIKNQRVNRSVSGGAKWSRLGEEIPAPAEYMGKYIEMNVDKFQEIKKKINVFLNMPEDMQKKIFKRVLSGDAFYVTGFLWTYQNGWMTE